MLKNHLLAIVTQNANLFRKIKALVEPKGIPVLQLAYSDRMEYLIHWVEDADLILLVDGDEQVPSCLEWIRKTSHAHPNTVALWVQQEFDQQNVVQAVRAGARDLLVGNFSADDFLSLLRRAARMFLETHTPSVVLGFMGATGGAGTSTLVTNVAAEIVTATQQSVGVLDLSVRPGGVGLQLNLAVSNTLFSIADRYDDLDVTLLRQIAAKHDLGVSLVAAEQWPADRLPVPVSVVRQTLLKMQETYPYVLVDLPGELTPLAQTIFEAVDGLMLVVPTSLAGATAGTYFADALKRLDYPPRRVHWLATTVHDSPQVSVAQLRRVMASTPVGEIPFAPGPISHAIGQGTSLAEVAPRAALTKKIRSLATTLVEIHKTKREGGEPAARPESLSAY